MSILCKLGLRIDIMDEEVGTWGMLINNKT